MEEDRETCWICLCGPDGLDTGEDSEVVRVCACPRVCHKRCLGRWQLQNAGKREEKYCRFCQQRYPDWRNSLTPGEITPSTPVMAVSVRGKVYKLRVRPGPEGKEDFKRQIRQLLGFTQDMDFDVIFECKTPHNGAEKVQLHGFEAFEAASWCAAVSAAKRKKAKQEAAARAAAAAAAAAAAGGGSALTPMASCPAALSSHDVRPPSSSGSSTGAGSSSDGGCDTATQHDADTSIAPSAFATATATAAAAAGVCPAGAVGVAAQSLLLSNAVSEPQPGLAAALHTSSSPGSAVSSTGMFGLRGSTSSTGGHSVLQPAGSSLPHAIIEEQPGSCSTPPAAAAAAAAGAVSAGTYHSRRRSSSCPGQGLLSLQEVGPSNRHSQAGAAAATAAGSSTSHSSSSSRGALGLHTAVSEPLVYSSSHDSGAGSSSRVGSRDVARSSSSQLATDQEQGADGDRGVGKVGRWLRRVLHLEALWRGAAPANVFMGVV